MQIVTKLPNENIQNYQLEMFDSEGWGVNYQMQIVTKLPNENIQNYQLAMFDSGGSVNYQMQIVTKLPNENIQNYQLEMFDSGGGKLPNANCHQTTKWKCPKLPTSNVLREGGGNYQIQIVTKLPNENIQNYQLEMFDSGGSVNYQIQIVTKLPNENIQNYQLEMFDSWGGWCKLPNANCDQITKWKYPKLPTRNVRFWGGGEITKCKL